MAKLKRVSGKPCMSPYVGRAAELGAFCDRVEQLKLGIGSALLVTGPPKVGKTRFLSQCEQLASPFDVLHDFDEQKLNDPHIFLIDDVHSACDRDADLFSLFVHLSRNRPFLIVATIDSSAVTSGRVLGPRIRRWCDDGATTMELPKLSDEETALLVRTLIRDGAFSKDIESEIIRISAGIPQYAMELVTAATNGASLGDLVPDSARAHVTAILKALDREVVAVIRLCSVLGERFAARWLLNIFSDRHDIVASALQTATDEGLILQDTRNEDWFSFSHAAIAKAVYASIIPLKRISLHRLAAARLRELPIDPDVALTLSRQAHALGRLTESRRYLAQSALAEMRRGGFGAAADIIVRLIPHVKLGSLRWKKLMFDLVSCRWQLCQYGDLVQHCEAILANLDYQRDRESALNILRMLVYAYLNNDDRAKAREAVLRCESLASHRKNEYVEVLLLLASAYSAAGQREQAKQLFERIDASMLSDANVAWRYAYARLAYDSPFSSTHDLHQAVKHAVRQAESVGLKAVHNSYLAGAGSALQTGDMITAIRYCDDASAIADREVSKDTYKMRRESLKSHALTRFLSGDLLEAQRNIVSNVSWRESGCYNESMHSGIAVFIGTRMADISLINAFFNLSLLRHVVESGEAELCGIMFRGYGEIMEARSMHVELQALLLQCIDRDVVDPYLFIALTAAKVFPRSMLAGVLDYTQRNRVRVRGPVAPAHEGVVRAVIDLRSDRKAAARQHAGRSAEIFAGFGWRLSLAYALELAGDSVGAASVYKACGASADASRLMGGPRRRMKYSVFGRPLTPAEWKVASLIARGYPDKRIASSFAISVRTVHIHVGAILKKLGVSSRTQVTSAVLANGARLEREHRT